LGGAAPLKICLWLVVVGCGVFERPLQAHTHTHTANRQKQKTTKKPLFFVFFGFCFSR
jgi:hypothetical protein